MPSFQGEKLFPKGIVILQSADHLCLSFNKPRRPWRELRILRRSYHSSLLLLWGGQKRLECFPENRGEKRLPPENIARFFSFEEPHYLRINSACFLNLLNNPFEKFGFFLTEEPCGSGKLLNQQIPSSLLSLPEEWKERNKLRGRDLMSFDPERKKERFLKNGLAFLLKKRHKMRGFGLDKGEESFLPLSLSSCLSFADEVDKGPFLNLIVL